MVVCSACMSAAWTAVWSARMWAGTRVEWSERWSDDLVVVAMVVTWVDVMVDVWDAMMVDELDSHLVVSSGFRTVVLWVDEMDVSSAALSVACSVANWAGRSGDRMDVWKAEQWVVQ